jgi:hypothetical protein
MDNQINPSQKRLKENQNSGIPLESCISIRLWAFRGVDKGSLTSHSDAMLHRNLQVRR